MTKGSVLSAGRDDMTAERSVCRLTLRLAPCDDDLARVIAVVSRMRWEIVELQHRRTSSGATVRLTAARRAGQPLRLVTALEREIVVVSVEQ